jgi:DNA repair ATPase RecN
MNNELLDKKELNKRFLEVAMGLIGREPGQVKNQKELAEKIDEFPVVFSQIKSDKRSVSISQLTKLINEFDLNANYFLRQDNTKEHLKHHHLEVTSFGDTHHNKGSIAQGNFHRSVQGSVHGNVYNIEKKIQNSSPEVQEYIDNLNKENERINGDLTALKKMIGILEIQLSSATQQIEAANQRLNQANDQLSKKDERLYSVQQELLEVYKGFKKK